MENPLRLSITSRIVSGVVIVDISGRLCFLENGLREQIDELLQEGHRDFILNMVGVPYVDSYGLGQLTTVLTSVEGRAGQLILLRPTDHLRTLLHISRLDTIFQISGDECEAVRRAHRSIQTSLVTGSSLP
jgi:anti-sigma B factor antagonist